MHRDCYNKFIKDKVLTDELIYKYKNGIKNKIIEDLIAKKIDNGISKDEAEKEAEKEAEVIIQSLDNTIRRDLPKNEIFKEELEKLYNKFLAGTIHGFFNCLGCKQIYPF